MLGDRWITDTTPTDRFPNYTRGNAGEVLADPVSPLGWTFCCEPGMVIGCVDGFEAMGVFDASEYGTPPETFGMFGGYFYNSLTQGRLFGVRSGAGWQAIDNTYFDNTQDIPPYVEEPWHISPRHSEKLANTMAWIMSTDSVPEIDLQKYEAKACRDSRPDLSTQSNEQLVARARTLQRHMRAMFSQVVWASLGATVGPAVLSALTAEVDPTATTKLITGVGDVDSAAIAGRMFELSRLVRKSPTLTAEFERGFEGLLDRLRGSSDPDAVRFLAEVDDYTYEHGSRGPNEYDIYSWSYETKPELVLSSIERLRLAADDADPVRGEASGAAERERLTTQFREMFADNPEALGTFEAALHSASVFMSARERCKCNNIRTIAEVRMCFYEVGQRMVDAGHLDHKRQICMLLADEVDGYLEDPASFKSLLADREADYLSLYDLEPPYIVDKVAPPLSQWQRKSEMSIAHVKVGDVLQGVAGSPGVATGIARVLLDLSDPFRLEVDDILIAPQTDPAWTPLFLSAGAVITNVGAVGTHAVIVSRELGIPCVPSIPDATRRIPDGATITVDGSKGTVTIVALP
jgi:phosphohistidine swiveling domain-containing protein